MTKINSTRLRWTESIELKWWWSIAFAHCNRSDVGLRYWILWYFGIIDEDCISTLWDNKGWFLDRNFGFMYRLCKIRWQRLWYWWDPLYDVIFNQLLNLFLLFGKFIYWIDLGLCWIKHFLLASIFIFTLSNRWLSIRFEYQGLSSSFLLRLSTYSLI